MAVVCLKALVFVLLGGTLVASYRMYQDRIPNGDSIPHPCKPNFVWKGVGHLQVNGGGPRNRFGEDFHKYRQWTNDLCRKDSDGDGMTNGQELGDPDCIWKVGDLPSRLKSITHPGICNPWGSPKCEASNKWVTCDTGEYKCDAINEPGVLNMTVRFPKTLVPANETTYYCMTFDLPAEGINHVIGSQPLLDNHDVMHHMTVFTCWDHIQADNAPYTCYMAQSGCSEVIAVWTLGMAGECLHKDAGFKIGIPGRRKIVLQHHWTNPELKDDYEDSSGMILYYTPKLRKYNAGVLTVGEFAIEIPPGEPRVTVKNTCPERCTKKMIDDKIFLVSGWNHMHYLGYQQTVTLNRVGEESKYITRDDVFSYDNPVIHQFEDPIELRSGDRLETTCTYRSTSKEKTTFFGYGTHDEMCFVFLTIFPVENISSTVCVGFKSFHLCDLENGVIYGCNTVNFKNTDHPDTKAIFDKVLANCNVYGGCRKECPKVVAEVRKDPCLQGDLEYYHLSEFAKTKNAYALKFTAALTSCDHQKNEKPTISGTRHSVSSISTLLTSLIWLCLVLLIRR